MRKGRPVSMRRAIVLSLSLTASLAIPAMAKEPPKTPPQETPSVCPICHRANDPQASYTEKAGATLARGAMNTALGWTELLVQPASEVNAGGNVVVGIGKGVGYAVKRTAVGLGELLTFWTPKGKQGYTPLAENCPLCMRPMPRAAAPSAESPTPAKTPSQSR